jgi:hypothetical protein
MLWPIRQESLGDKFLRILLYSLFLDLSLFPHGGLPVLRTPYTGGFIVSRGTARGTARLPERMIAVLNQEQQTRDYAGSMSGFVVQSI